MQEIMIKSSQFLLKSVKNISDDSLAFRILKFFGMRNCKELPLIFFLTPMKAAKLGNKNDTRY